MKKDMLTLKFAWFIICNNFIKAFSLVFLLMVIIFTPIVIKPLHYKIQTQRTYTDGKIFIKANNHWYLLDNVQVVLNGKMVTIRNSHVIDGIQVLCFLILFGMFVVPSVTFDKNGMLNELWVQYNYSSTNIVKFGQEHRRELNGRIYKINEFNKFEGDYPLVYDRVAIRTKTINNILN